MRVATDNDYILLEHFVPETKSKFITTGIGNDSPFFIVVAENASPYEVGDKVIPRPDRLMPMMIDGKEYFWVEEENIMGSETDE